MSSVRRAVLAAMLALGAAAAGIIGIEVNQDEPRIAYPASSAYEIPQTQDIRYRVADRPPQLLQGVIDYARTQLSRPHHQGEGFIVREYGIPLPEKPRARELDPALDRYRSKLDGADVGDMWFIRAVVDGYTLYTLKIDLNPAAVIDTEGTLPVDIVVGTLRTNYPGISIGGIYSCRTISGSGTLSQHAYANAADVFGTSSNLNEAAYGMLALARGGYIPVSQILWDYKNLITGRYVSDHTSHIHFTGSPLLSGACRRAG